MPINPWFYVMFAPMLICTWPACVATACVLDPVGALRAFTR